MEFGADGNWRYSLQARKATAQLMVDRIAGENLPAAELSCLFDFIVDGLEYGVEPGRIMDVARGAEGPGQFKTELSFAMADVEQQKTAQRALR